MRAASLIMVWLVAFAGVFAWPYVAGSSTVGDDITRRTVWVSLVYYTIAACLMLGLRPVDWTAATATGWLTRLCWTLAWAAFVTHVGVAFHFYHHWSHAAAVEHVRERSGVGEGLFVSYLFTAAWTADVAWWWLWPGGYASRPGWIGKALHGFMLFMIVMGAVVYEAGAVRWLGVAMCVVLIARWVSCSPLPALRERGEG